MIVVMKRQASPADLDRVTERLEGFGFVVRVLEGVERTVVAASGDDTATKEPQIRAMDGVDECKKILQPYKLAGRQFKPEPSKVDVRGLSVGGTDLIVMAGPCAVESEEQLLATARAVRDAGATMLRGGAFKPRT